MNMRFKIIIILSLLSFAVQAQINSRIIRLIPIDTVATPPTFPAYAPAGFYYNVSTGKITFKDATGYHKVGSGGSGGGGDGTIVAVNGTTNEIDASGTTTRTLSLSTTFKSAVGYIANPLSQFSSTTSAQLRSVLSDEVGTGAFYTIGGALGTPASATGTNFTGIPITGLSTFSSSQLATQLTNESGTGVVAYTTSPVFTTPDLGTPSALNLTNATGLPISGIAPSTSLQLSTIITNETGTGSLVFSSSPALTTPSLGTPTDINLLNGTGLPITGITSSTSTQLATLLTNETGNGQAVFSVNPALTTPDLGTPSAATLTNATGLPLATGVTAFNSSTLSSKMSDEVGSGALYFGQPIEAHTTVTGDYTLISSNISNYQNAGIITVTGSTPVDLTFPASTFPALTKIVVNNQSSETVTLHYAVGVTANDGDYNQIFPHNSAVLFQRAVNTLDVLGTGPNDGGGNCFTNITSYTANHTLSEDDITPCNHNGFIRFTPTTNIIFTVPDDATLDVDDGTFIVLSNQSVDDTITVVFDVDISGGGHDYDEILPGETAVISNVATDVWDLNGTKPAAATGGSGSGDALTTDPLSQFAATSSAQLRGVLTDEVGTGAFYTVGGALGTPASGTATNLTGLPISTGVSGLGTGVATALATPSSANLAAAITDETGTGSVVLSSAPSLTNPDVTTQSVGNNSTKAASTAYVTAGFVATPTWTTLTATITGYTGTPTQDITYIIMGKLCMIRGVITGTKNGSSGAIAITNLPAVSRLSVPLPILVLQNVTVQSGRADFGAASSTLNIYAGPNGSSFTASQAANIYFNLFYEIQ